MNMSQLSGGFAALLKEGARHFTGVEDTIVSNIEACKQLCTVTRTSLGPYGMNKMILTGLEKLFVTSDAATILKELDVNHLAAKLIVMAAKMQESEMGDGTNLVVILAGEFLTMAQDLLKIGLHPSDIISGYEAALLRAETELAELVCHTVADLTDLAEVEKCLKPVLATKIYGFEDTIAHLAAQACLIVTENAQKFDLDNLRIVKLQGASLAASQVYRGLVLKRGAEGVVKHVVDARVAVYNCPLDTQYSDTKGTVLIKSAEDLKNYTTSEEDVAETFIKSIADSGVNVVVCGGSISEICMHFLEQHSIMVLKVASKFELRRVTRVLGGNLIVRLSGPTAEELGRADLVSVEEVGSEKITIFKREADNSRLATVMLRASTGNVLDDAERALDDAFNTYRVMRKDKRFVPGAGAAELQLGKRIKEYGQTCPGLEQYAVIRYGQAFEVVPKTLAEVSGQDGNQVLALLHADGGATVGVNIEEQGVLDVADTVLDLYLTKLWAIKLATDAALTVLKVDQIIMAKPSGGPSMDKKPVMEED